MTGVLFTWTQTEPAEGWMLSFEVWEVGMFFFLFSWNQVSKSKSYISLVSVDMRRAIIIRKMFRVRLYFLYVADG